MNDTPHQDLIRESWLDLFVRPVPGSNLPFGIGQVIGQHIPPTPIGISQTVFEIQKHEAVADGEREEPTSAIVWMVPACAVQKA